MFPNLSEIKQKRVLLNLTQKQLAKLSQVSQSMIAKIEAKKIDPSYSIVQKLFNTLNKIENPKKKKCFDIMNKKIISIDSNEKVSQASKIMHKYSVSQLPVMENKRIIGTISEDNIFEKIRKEEDYSIVCKKSVKEIMGNPLPTIDKNTLVENILPLIKNVSAIIVFDKDAPIGIITKSDLI